MSCNRLRLDLTNVSHATETFWVSVTPVESEASGPRAVHIVENWYADFRDCEQD